MTTLSKHFINDPTHLVLSAIRSASLLNPTVAVDEDDKIIYRLQDPTENGKVSIISGGGAGHEPSFSGFVGRGFLTAAISGTIFASPSAKQIGKGLTQRISTDNGVLVIVMNYTGDVLNFGVAVEKARAAGVDVKMVVVGDDVGVGRSKGGKVGRRGIAGTVLVQKTAAALAESGASLEKVYNVAKLVSENIVSIGTSLAHVHVPGRGEMKDELDEGEAEIGMGIHNESGSERRKATLPELVKTMLSHLLDSSDSDRNFLKISSSDQILLLINNLGGVSVLEIGGIVNEVVEQLKSDWKINPVRILAGTYMTSLNGLGFSITLLRLQDLGISDVSMLDLIEAATEASGWPGRIVGQAWQGKKLSLPISKVEADEKKSMGISPVTDSTQVKKSFQSALHAVIEAESKITEYDTIVGDGDCGIGLKRGAESLLKLLDNLDSNDISDPLTLLQNIAKVIENTMDGTSGALYAIFINSLRTSLGAINPSAKRNINSKDWAEALSTSMKDLGKYTPALEGDRTLVDALIPFIETLKESGSLSEAAKASNDGMERTKDMKASLGRTVYVGGSGWQGIPDPGAYGLAIFFKGLANGL